MSIEMLIYLPVLLALVFYLVNFFFFYLESLSLDVATAESAKTLVSAENAEDLMLDLFSSDLGQAIPLLGQLPWGTKVSKLFILHHDASGFLCPAAVPKASVRRFGKKIEVSCSYQSRYLPAMTVTSRACERSWRP